MVNNKEYYERMESAYGDKARILPYIKDGDSVLDVGAGTGMIALMILEACPKST